MIAKYLSCYIVDIYQLLQSTNPGNQEIGRLVGVAFYAAVLFQRFN